MALLRQYQHIKSLVGTDQRIYDTGRIARMDVVIDIAVYQQQMSLQPFGQFRIGLDAIYDYFEINIKAFKTDESYDVYKKLQYALSKLGLDDAGYQTKILKAIAPPS